MLRKRSYLCELADTEDYGFTGKNFEKVLVKAFGLVGMDLVPNIASGPGWDIKTVGDKWLKMISGKLVNIKVYGTKWMISSSELYRALPWESLPDNFDTNKAEKKVRKILNSKGLPQIYFLKPKDKGIQDKIVAATNGEDVEILKELLVKKNFRFTKLGKNYGVRILDNGERVTSIAITRGGKVFMRSEKPRKLGGVVSVTFRTPTPKISKKERPVAKGQI